MALRSRRTREALPDRGQIVVDAVSDTLLERPAQPVNPHMPVSEVLHARLLPADLEELAARRDGELAALWEENDERGRRRLALPLIVHYGMTEAMARVGLTDATPPEGVHAMARGPLASGGDPVFADLVVRKLVEEAQIPLPEGATLLDFGCSSGRVLRVLAAWRPDLDCVGCDPNDGAIAWAREHLPMARFEHQPPVIRLPFADRSVDAVYAISIWSHFDEERAIAWLGEMHRLIKPGGGLLLTTHGVDTLAATMRRGEMTRESASEVGLRFLAHGHHWYDVFGDEGDWGVTDSGWGNGFLTLDWLAARVTPDWSVRLFTPGGVDQNQDVIVLERR